MNFKHLTIEKERHVAIVIFNRPDALNALNVQLMHEIIATAEAFREDVETRVVIFTGAGSGHNAHGCRSVFTLIKNRRFHGRDHGVS